MKNTFMTVISFFAVIATVLAVIAGISFLTKPAADDHIHTYRTIGNTATCEQGGEKFEICTECGIKRTLQSSALGHDIEITDIPATCIERGLHQEACRRMGCGFIISESSPVLEHEFEFVETVSPICARGGYDYYRCLGCGAAMNKNETPALDHVFELVETKEPTCIEQGGEYWQCYRCGTEDVRNVLSALGHDLESHEGRSASCSSVGWKPYEACRRCSYSTYQLIPALEHQFKNGVCTVCGYVDTLTTLADTTWEIRSSFDASYCSGFYSLNYTIDGLVESGTDFNIGWIYSYDRGDWISNTASIGCGEDITIESGDAPFTITIRGGHDAENATLIKWFRENADFKPTIS